ncbi:MAG: fumarylacetoacetate hydrolase family protein [Gammaproteobacteria bacterium]|nr:fumarylacetoacetate hydrolase family protein [Gammaproteobacteria bacterium]
MKAHPVEPGQHYVGLLVAGAQANTKEVVDLTLAAPELPHDMLSLLALGDAAFPIMEKALQTNQGRIPLNTIRLLAPIPAPPRNIFCVGKNYPEHMKEVQSIVASANDTQGDAPSTPIIFTKAPSTVIGPMEPIPAWLDETDSVDYEGELAVIIGKHGRGITREYAMQHVYGYTILNDVTSRRIQKRHQQWFLGKSLDGFCPMGPCLVTRDEINNVGELRVQTRINNELRQDDYVREMIFDIPVLIKTLSKGMTLQCGDIIATGTPAGVGMGFKPPKFLKTGDRISITIEPIGTLENPVE